jgi:transposase-like protein
LTRQWRIAAETREAIVRMYTREGVSIQEVADRVGVNYKTAKRALVDAGVQIRGSRPGVASALNRERSSVARWYGWHADRVAAELAKGRTVEDIAEEAGINASLLAAHLPERVQ